MFDWFAADITSHPRRWLLFVAMATAAAVVGASHLGFDDDPRALYMGDDQAFDQLRNLYEEFGADDQDILLVLTAEDVFSAEVMNVGRDLWLAAAEVEGVERVYSIYSLRRRGSRLIPLIPRREAAPERYAEAKRMAMEHPLAVNQFVSPDATTLLLIARLAGDPESLAKIAPPVEQLRKLADDASLIPGVKVLATGHPVLRIDILSALVADLVTFVAASAAVALLVAWLVFGRLAAVVIVVLTPTFGVFWIVSLMPVFGLAFNAVNGVLPTLVYAIGVTDAVHLLIGLRRRLAAGMPHRQAVQEMIEALALPCFLTSITTAIGFGSLGLAREPLIQQFGLICAAGTMTNFVAVLTVMPLLMMTPLGSHLLPKANHRFADDAWLNLRPLVRFVESSPRLIVAASLAVAAAMGTLCLRLGPDFLVTEIIPAESPSVMALDSIDKSMGGGMLGYVVMDWPADRQLDDPLVLDTLARAHDEIESFPEFHAAFSVRTLLQAGGKAGEPLSQSFSLLNDVPNDELARLVHLDTHRLLVSFHIPNIGAAELAPAFASLEQRLNSLALAEPGFHFHVTGTLPVVARNLWSMIGDLARSLTASTILVFAVIGLTLRSWKFGLMSLLPNILPLMATSTVLVLAGEPLRIVSVISYSLCLGIAVDDTIHFLVRFQREEQTKPLRDAIEHAMQTAGIGIVTSSVILLGGFSVMLLSGVPSIRWLALLCDVAMLTALVSVLIILPALLACFCKDRPVACSDPASSSPVP